MEDRVSVEVALKKDENGRMFQIPAVTIPPSSVPQSCSAAAAMNNSSSSSISYHHQYH